MKCNCERCEGNGQITCLDCDGQGTVDQGIEFVDLKPQMTGYAELVELQKDARRVRRQAEQLIAANPARRDSYAAQLESCLKEIDAQANRELKGTR